MNSKSLLVILLTGVGSIAFGQTLLGSFTWSNNGHTYESWSAANGISYQDAQAFALSRGGTLATMTSADETNAVLANLGSVLPSSSYLGAQQPSTETDPLANWHWVTGETWSYTNWSSGEPNDFNGSASEQNLEMYTDGTWNDIGDNMNGFNNGLLVETVPEPASMLVICGLTIALLKRPKQK